jgi:hypothetical protein
MAEIARRRIRHSENWVVVPEGLSESSLARSAWKGTINGFRPGGYGMKRLSPRTQNLGTPYPARRNRLPTTHQTVPYGMGLFRRFPWHFVPGYFHPIPSGYPARFHFFVSYLLRFFRLFAAIPTPTSFHD